MYILLKGGVPAHIGGNTQFGDNVEDEWFIVYLLQRITEDFPELAARWDKMVVNFILVKMVENYLVTTIQCQNIK